MLEQNRRSGNIHLIGREPDERDIRESRQLTQRDGVRSWSHIKKYSTVTKLLPNRKTDKVLIPFKRTLRWPIGMGGKMRHSRCYAEFPDIGNDSVLIR